MRQILTLISKDGKDFFAQPYGTITIFTFVVLSYLFLWLLPQSSYLSFGYSTTELYSQFISYLFLFVIPMIAINAVQVEKQQGMLELIRSRGMSWLQLLMAKYFFILIIAFLIILFTVPQLFVIEELSLNYGLSPTQVIGAIVGALIICSVYTAVSLFIASWVDQTILAIVLSIVICFLLHSGLSYISDVSFFSPSQSWTINKLSLAYQIDQVSIGILRFSSIVYILSLSITFLALANSSFSISRK